MDLTDSHLARNRTMEGQAAARYGGRSTSVAEAMRQQARRRVLAEAAYKSPADFTTLFWDFYALYNLWWTYGSGKQAYGGHLQAEPRAGGLGTKVDYAFDECSTMMASALLTIMQANIADEAANGEDELYALPDKVARWCMENGMQECVGPDGFTAPTPDMLRRGKPPMSTMAKFFLAPFWGDMDSGWRQAFGDENNIGVSVGANGHVQKFAVAGEPWAKLCNLTGNLVSAKKQRSTPRMLAAVDALMHAEHNNGSIFNRSPVLKLGIRFGKEELDARRDAMSSDAFLPRVSPFVRNLTNALEPVRTEEAFNRLGADRRSLATRLLEEV